jgi:hypothetical protein
MCFVVRLAGLGSDQDDRITASKQPEGSDQAARSHRGRLARADHQMIEHADTHELQRIAQLPGDVAIGGRGFGDT